MKNYTKQLYSSMGSKMTMLLMACCLLFVSCQENEEELNNLRVEEPPLKINTNNLYYYGNNSDFEKFRDMNVIHLRTDAELQEAFSVKNNSYALFVGSGIDVRSGLVDEIRNSGIPVTKIQAASTSPAALERAKNLSSPASDQDVNDAGLQSATSGLDSEKLSLTTYQSVNGQRAMLASIAENIEEAVPAILEWSEKERENARLADVTVSSTGKTREQAMNFGFSWPGLANFSVDTEIYKAPTDGYMLNNGSSTVEFPDVFIYEHKLTVTPTDTDNSFKYGDIQVIQEPYYSYPAYQYVLREWSPLNSSNGVLSGRTGSDSFGYGLDFGIDATGGSIGSSFDWTHTTDWSIPASQINTYHDPSQEKFHVMYDIDGNGSWAGNSATAECYTYYAASDPIAPLYTPTSYDYVPVEYRCHFLKNNAANNRTLRFELEPTGDMFVTAYYKGYYTDQYDIWWQRYSW